MPNITITLPHINVSLQIGDQMYYVPTPPLGGFDFGDYSNIVNFGTVFSINYLTNTILVNWNLTSVIPTSLDYLLFSKDPEANTPSLIGYYADVEFMNTSSEKVELFAVGSEVFESSK